MRRRSGSAYAFLEWHAYRVQDEAATWRRVFAPVVGERALDDALDGVLRRGPLDAQIAMPLVTSTAEITLLLATARNRRGRLESVRDHVNAVIPVLIASAAWLRDACNRSEDDEERYAFPRWVNIANEWARLSDALIVAECLE